MPIFETKDGQKYDVDDEYINDFRDENPDAKYILERNGQKYRVAFDDYQAFIDTFDGSKNTPQAPQAPTAPTAPTAPKVGSLNWYTAKNAGDAVKNVANNSALASATKAKNTEATDNLAKVKGTADVAQNTQELIHTTPIESKALELAQFKAKNKAMFDSMAQRTADMGEYYTKAGADVGKVVETAPQYNAETGEFETQYITPTLNREENKAIADAEAREYKQMLKDVAIYNKYFTETNMTTAAQLRSKRARLADVERKISERIESLQAEQEQLSGGVMGFINELGRGSAGRGIAKGVYTQDDETAFALDEEYKTLRAIKSQLEEQIQKLENKQDNEQNGTQPVFDFLKGTAQNLFAKNTFDFGRNSLNDSRASLNISDKITRGEELTDTEEQLIYEQFANQLADEYIGDLGKGLQFGHMTGDIAGFAIDMALMGPSGSGGGAIAKGLTNALAKRLGVKTTEGLAKKLVERGLFATIKNKGAVGKLLSEVGIANTSAITATRALGIGAEYLAIKSPIMTVTQQGQKAAAKIIDTKLGDVELDYYTGELRYANDKGFGEATYEALGDQIIENASEMIGGHLPGISNVTRLGSRGLTASVLRATREGAGTVISKVNQFLGKVGVHSVFDEISEEYIGQAWRTIFRLESAKGQDGNNNLLNAEFHSDIWCGMGASIGFMHGIGLTVGYGAKGVSKVMSGVEYQRLKHQVNKASAYASSIIPAEQWDNLQTLIDAADNVEISNVAEQIAQNKDLTDRQKDAAMNYINRLMIMRGFNLAKVFTDKAGVTMDADAEAVNQSYADGYESNDAQEMADARKAVEIEEAKLRSALSGIDQEGVNAIMAEVVADPVTAMQRAEDEALRDAIADYANAKAVYDGMQQRVADDIDTQIAVSDATIDRRTNRNTGKIQSVTLKNDKKVYVVGGTLNTTENGSVDFEHSDESIIVMDETGALEYSSPKNVLSIDNEIDPTEEKAISAEAIRQQAQAQAEANMSGKLTFTAGEQVQLKQEDGTYLNGTIVGPYIEDGKVIGGLFEVETQDGIKLPFKTDVLQTWADEARQARVEQFDADRSAEREQTRQIEQASEVVTEETAAPAEEMPTEPQTSALERVPTDEQGNPIYEQVDAETAWDAIVEQTEGDVAMAQTVANDMVKDKEKALKAAQNAKSKGGATIAEKIASEQERKANIQNAEQELAIWQAIASVPEVRQQAMAQAQAQAEAERIRQIKEAEERAKIEAEEKAKAEAEALKAQQEADAIRLQQEAEAREAEEKAKAITEAEEARRESLRQRAERWGKETGVKVHIMESLDDVKTVKARNAIKMGKRITGWYVKKTGEAYIYLPNIESNRDIDDTFVHEVVAHKGISEMLGKERFDALCDKVWASMSEDAQKHFETYPGVKEIKDESERHRAAADEYMAHLAESTNLTEEEQGVWSKIVDFIHDVMVKLGFDTITDEDIQRVVRASYANLRKKNVGRNKQITESSRNLNNGTVRFSVATYKDWTDSNGQRHKGTRDQVIDRMTKSKFSKKDISTMIRKMDLAYDYMRKLETLTDADGNVRFDEFVKWAETKPYYKQIGKQYIKAITSLVSNGDYPINLELTTDCIKREAFTHLLNELVKRGADISKMGPGEIVTIQKLMKQYGIEVACELCFVEGKRLQIVNWAQQIVNDWNDAIAEAGLQTDEKFQFGKDGDAFIPVEEWKDYKDKTALQKAMRAIDQVEFMFKGIDPKTVIEQTAKNEAAVKAYIEEAQEKWASKSKKPKAQWKPTDEQKREIRALRIEGLTPTYINENMKEYKEAYEQMRAEWVAGAEGRDADAFTPNAEQWTKLDKIRNKQIDTVKQKMVRLIMEYPEMRKKMELNDLLGSKGLMNIRQQHGEAYEQLYSIILQRFGTGTPKPVQDAVPYDGEVMTLTQSKYDKANAIGGARLFSFSDFDITKVFDYMQMFFDLEANKQRLQSYTKEVAAILQFGRSNAKMNISTLAKAEVPESVKTEYKNASEAQQKELRHQYAENAGLKMNEDGTIAGINFSEEHSVSPEFAKTIFHDDTRNKDCGAIMVGCSVNHAIYSALQNWIRMVIPFHLSGMPIAAREKTDVLWYTDNTAFQSTRKKVDGKWKKISASEDTFSFYDDMDKKGWNMRDKTRQYLAWCEEHGYRPKFDWGINSQKYIEYCEAEGYTPNQQLIEAMDADTVDGVWNQYYKFLTDFTAYKPIFNEYGEMIDEVPSPQQAIVTNFDMTELEKQVLYEADDSMLAHRESNIDRTQQYIDEIADKVEQYLSGNLSEENMDLKEDVFYENNADAERYLEELEVHEGVRFRFLGENGAERLDHAEEASTRLDNLAVAREMESAGAEAKNIKMATGWERGADNKWRYETNDIKIKDWDWTVKAKRNLTLKDIIDDEELFIAYPSLANVSVKKTSSYGGGSYSKENNTIKVGTGLLGLFTRKGADVPESTKNEVMDTLVHEIQHTIQHEEGFAVGGSPDMYRPGTDTSKLEQKIDDYNEAANAFNLQSEWYRRSPQAQRELDALNELHKEIQKERKALQLGEEGYQRLAGEVEAYNVGKRKGMTYEERLASLATETEDVAREDQLFIYDSLESEQAATGTAFSGGGLVEAGLKDLIDSKFAIEYDEKIAGVYRNNHGDHILVADIRGVDIEELASEVDGGLDYFHASPVCKRFSTMRATQGETALDIETAQATADIISEKQPKVVTIENVPQYKNSEAMSVITDALDANGYTWDANVYNSADYGAATSRRRLIVRAVKDGALPPMPQKVKEKRGWYEVVEDLVADLPTTSLAPWQRERLEADGIIPEEVKEPLFVFDGGGKNGKARYAYGSSPLPTITASGSADRIVMPGGEVKLVSPRVLARIMGLPDSYQLPESRTLAHTILGNGVPVEMTEAVIAPMLEQFQEDDDIRFREANERQAIFVSNAQKAVEDVKQEKATPQQWLAMLQAKGGLKAGEDKWLGLSDWLKSLNVKILTKQEVLDFIAENQIQIEEVKYAEYNNDFFDALAQDRGEEFARSFSSAFGISQSGNVSVRSYNGAISFYNAENGTNYDADSLGHRQLLEIIDWAQSIYDNAEVINSTKPIDATRLDYTTFGLANKGEIALTVPTIESYNEDDEIHFGDAGDGRAIAWIRFGDTKDVNGNDVLVIDEIQSKRHQDGREKGYRLDGREAIISELKTTIAKRDAIVFDVLRRQGYKHWADSEDVKGKFDVDVIDEAESGNLGSQEEMAKIKSYNQRIDELNRLDNDLLKKVPDAPFDKNWHELAMKRMLRYAAENGYDKVAWTTGAQQAARYDMRQQVDNIQVEENNIEEFNDGTPIAKNITINTPRGNKIRYQADAEGNIRGGEYGGKNLKDVVGKELAEKIMQPGSFTIEEEGLAIGGEGMKGFYDKMLPSFVNKYTKKWGAKVGEVTMPSLEEGYQTMHSVDVTPQMKEDVMEGQVMFRAKRKSRATEIDETNFNQTKQEVNREIDQATGLFISGGARAAKAIRKQKEMERKALATEVYSKVLAGDFNPLTLQQIEKYINDVTPRNPFGRRISQRVPQKVERGVYGGKTTDAIDLLFSRISESAVPASRRSSEEGRREIEERKKEALKGWAIATGNWHTDLSAFTDDKEPFAQGTDSKVYTSKDGGYVIKASKGKPYGKRFRADIDNVALFNHIFPNSKYDILGYGEIDGNFVRILRQPVVDFSEDASLSEDERVAYMAELGFKPLNKENTAFSNGDFVAADLQKANIVKDAMENISIIDADMKLHTTDIGGNYSYAPVEEDVLDDDISEEDDIRFRVVEDKAKLAELESGDKVTAYRAVQIKKDGKIFSPMASRLKSTESGTKQEKNEAAQMKQWDEAVESLDKVDENGHITIKDEDGGTTEVSYNPYGHCCVNSMMNDQFKRAWERDELYVMRVSAPESELTSGYHAEKAKDAVGIHKWKVGAVGRQLPEEKRREILLTRWMKNEEVMTWESVAEDWIKILDGEDVVVPFNVVPRKILNMIADAGVQIVAPENGMQKANKAYQQWLADPIGYVGDTELPMHVKALNEVEDDVRYRVGESLSGIVERIEQQSEQTNVADWMAKQNAVRAISGEMNQLRRAMSAQRKYDLTTVKAITRLAKEMLTNGMLNGTSQYSVKRILGAVERAHGKQDVSIEVKTLMDVMIDTQLQQSQKDLKGMLSIKGSKVNAKGVEVQGKLDADGVAVVKAFKNAMGLPKESVENQIAEAMNRMGSRNEAVAADAANEYNGLMLALQYAEDITESKAEEKELRDSLKEARQDYEDGTLSRDAYNELVRSTEDAIRQNKLERAEAYRDLISQVFGGVSESAERAKAWREAENERVNDIHHYANSDMEGRPTNEHHQDALKQKLMNALASFVFAPMATFDQMLRMFGKKNRRGEGYLYNHFMGGWLKSAENEYLGYREALKELDAKVEAVFDGEIKRWGQLFSIDRKLGDVDVEFWDGGQMRPHTLTQGNLLYIYMVNKMADGQMKLRKMGITDEHVDAITRKLDPRFKQIADWLQEEFLVNKRNKYNEVHKRMFGASMASIDNYFPLKILANARIEKVDVGAETTEATLPSTATGSIIKRRKNNTALDLLNANAFSVILDHLKDMEHWAAFAEFNRDLNTLLSYKRFRNQVINITSVYGGGKQLWNEFRNVCALASGSYRPKTTKVDSFMLKAARGLSAAKVAGRIWTAIKQITSLPAFLSETNVITLSKNLSTPWIAWHWTMTNLPIAHKRWSSMTSGDPRLLQTKRDWADWQNRIGEISSHIGMAPNAFVDALSVSIGSYSVYESAKRKYLGYGYSESEAERKAMQAATIAFNQTQQSSEGAFLSTMQVDRTWLAQMFSVFRNNSFAYTRQLYDAIRGLANSLTTEEVEYMAKQMERDGIDADKAIVNAKKEVAKGTIRDLARLMLFGGGLTYIWELMGNLPYLIFGDDDEEKEEMLDSAAQRAMLGGLDGLAGGEAIVEIALSAMTEEGTLRNVFKNGMPATSDIERALSKISSDQYSAFNDLVNIVAQYYAGINPQILIDAVVAIQDYCGDDAQTTNECALLIMRIIQCPQSQIDKVYFDEIDLSAEQASKLTPVQIAERYARYKRIRTSGGFDLLRTEEQADSAMTRKKNESLKLSKEAIGERLATDSTKILLEEYDAINERKREINKLREDMSEEEWVKLNNEFSYSYNRGKHKRIGNYKKEMKDLTNRWLKTRSKEEADSLVNEMFNVRNKMLQDIPKFDKAYQEWKEREEE